MSSRVLVLLLIAASGCATLNAKKHINAAEKAEAAGDLASAIREYEQAIAAAPNNPNYVERLEKAKTSGATAHADRARAAEAQSDWATAAESWKSALAFRKTAEHQARFELAQLRTQRVDPLDLYLATQKVAQTVPNDADIQRSLDDSRSSALKYYFKLAETYFDAGSFDAAYDAYEAARKVKPEDEAWKSLKYRITTARHFESVGDAKLKTGDALASYTAYQTAAQSADLPGLQAKMDRAKKGAGSLIEQIEQARAADRLKKWEDAAELYTILRDRPDAPKDVAEGAVRTRKESAKIRADRATVFAQQNQAEKAVAQLNLALEHTDLDPKVMSLYREAITAMEAGRVSDALAKLKEAGAAAPDVAIAAASLAANESKARAELETAKAIAAADPADAMMRVARLEALKASLPGYDTVRGALVKRAFAVLIERAEAKANEGNPKEAAELFQTSLGIAKIPANLAGPLDRGAKALIAGDFTSGEAAFKEATAQDAKSRLAKTGLAIASSLRLAELRREASAAESVEDPMRAAAAYRGILELAPDDLHAKEGLAALRDALIERALAAADANKAANHPGSAYVFVRRVLDLDPQHPKALDLLTRLSGSFDQRATPLGWVAPLVRGNRLGEVCPGAETDLRERVILYLTKTPKLGADYLQREQTKEIDAGKRPAPPLEIVAALEHCAVNAAGAAVGITMQIRLAGKVLVQEQAGASFDPATLPKDEAKEKLDEAKIRDSVMKEAARMVALTAQKNAAKLDGWRAQAAQSHLAKGDDEAVACDYATFVLAGDKLPAAEKAVLRDIERYIAVKFK